MAIKCITRNITVGTNNLSNQPLFNNKNLVLKIESTKTTASVKNDKSVIFSKKGIKNNDTKNLNKSTDLAINLNGTPALIKSEVPISKPRLIKKTIPTYHTYCAANTPYFSAPIVLTKYKTIIKGIMTSVNLKRRFIK